MKRPLTRCLLLLTLLALVLSATPISWAGEHDDEYVHRFQGVARQQLPSLVGHYEDGSDKGRLLKQDAAGYGTVQGYVKDTKTRKPIKGAKVRVVGSDRSARTNSKGYYRITRVPSGKRTIKASKRGYKAQGKTITVPRNRKRRVNFLLKKRGQGGAKLTVRPSSQCIKAEFEYRVIGSGFNPGEKVHLWHVGPDGVKQEFGTHIAYFGRIDATVKYWDGWKPGYYTMHAKGLTSNKHPTARFEMRKCQSAP